MTKKPTNTTRAISPIEIDATAKQLMQVIAEQTAQLLAAFYPEVAKTNVKRIHDAAQGAAADMPQYQPLVKAVVEGTVHKLEFELLRVGLINPEPVSVLKFATPARLEDCTTPNEVMSTTTLLSLLFNDSVRALLYFQGYRMSWRALGLRKKTNGAAE